MDDPAYLHNGGFMQVLKQDVIQAKGSVYINRNKNDFRSMPFSQIRFSNPDVLWFELYENKEKIGYTAVKVEPMNVRKCNLTKEKSIELQMLSGQNVLIVFSV